MTKELIVGLIIGIASMAGGLALGGVTARAVDSIAKSPDAYNKIRGSFMLGLVFIETVIIYALLCVILVIFVL